MNAPIVRRTPALTTLLAVALPYEVLACRIAEDWCAALGHLASMREAARNAIQPLIFDDSADDEVVVMRSFVAALSHRREHAHVDGYAPFARLCDAQIRYLASLALDRWLSWTEQRRAADEVRRDEALSRPTLPAPPALDGEHHDYDCRCPDCGELDDEHVEGPDYAYERAHSPGALG